MRPALARAISYTTVASLAGLAIWFTPSLGAVREIPFAPVVVARPAMPKTDYVSSPMTVYAPTGPVLDTVAVAGVITSSLYAALDRTAKDDLPPSARHGLAYKLADIFEYRVDMSRDIDTGDRFHILVERLSKPNGSVIVNKILGAKLALGGGQNELEAIHFNSHLSSSEYFDANGKSLRAAFLRTPVNFRRISSVFGLRFHPILGAWKNHTGTDYAAAMGTPVRSVGDGVILSIGWHGGYGNAIDIRHNNGMVTRYGHMRNFAKGLHRGSRVKMGSTIGYVGMTGLATGPHLHFEVIVNGVQRNPRTALPVKSGEPIATAEQALFQRERNETLASLNKASVKNENDE